MITAWWGKEASNRDRSLGEIVPPAPSGEPILVEPTRGAVRAEILGRRAAYTPDWTGQQATDAGIALVKLFSEAMEPVLQRLNSLPENAFIDFLNNTGVQPQPGTPAEATLVVKLTDTATQPLLIAGGYQVNASGPSGSVIFETDADLSAVPGAVKELFVLDRGVYQALDATTVDVPYAAFGRDPHPGVALFIGLSTGPDAIMGERISIGFQLARANGRPPPVSSGGVTPLTVPTAPLLQWDALDGGTYRAVSVLSDETDGLLQSGVVTLGLPVRFQPSIPDGLTDTAPLRWIRVQIRYGTYAETPSLLSVRLNAVHATAVQTYTNEALTPLGNAPGGGVVMSLSHAPVVPGSVQLYVDDTADLTFAGAPAPQAPFAPAPSGPAPRLWSEVDDLLEFGPESEVYTLDPGTGQIAFGDGVHGKSLPPGFRNVIAAQYRVGGGAAGAVAAGKVSSPVNSLPSLASIQNPLAASGGADPESQDEALLRGAREIRAHGRAVAPADYEILALRSPGALVARAHAVAGLHPAFPGATMPGVVGVFVVPETNEVGPPIPDSDTLRAVSKYLSTNVAPAGVEIVAAAPRFVLVRVEVAAEIDPAFPRGQVIANVLDRIDTFFDPVTGGEDGQGWPFGGAIDYTTLVKLLLQSGTGATAISRMRIVVDGVAAPVCSSASIAPYALIWPGTHTIVAIAPGESA